MHCWAIKDNRCVEMWVHDCGKIGPFFACLFIAKDYRGYERSFVSLCDAALATKSGNLSRFRYMEDNAMMALEGFEILDGTTCDDDAPLGNIRGEDLPAQATEDDGDPSKITMSDGTEITLNGL